MGHCRLKRSDECARIKRAEEEQRAREMIQRFEARAEAARARPSGYTGLPVRRLARMLAGRLEPTPAFLPGHVSSGRTQRPG